MFRKRFFFVFLIMLGLIAGIYATMELFGQNFLNKIYTPNKLVNLDSDYKGGIQRKIVIPESTAPKLRIAMAPIMSPEKNLPLYRNLFKYLGDRLGMEPVVIHRSSYAEINDLLQYDNCDIGFICSYAFVLGERSYGLQLLAIPRIKGKITYRSLIIVPAASSTASLMDLRGKRFASCDIISQSGWIYPALWLQERGENPKKFFSEHIIAGSHDRAIQAVASNFVDGAAVQSLVYEHMIEESPSLADKIKVIGTSSEFGMPPIVVNPKMDPYLRERIRKLLVTMDEEPEGEKILAGMGIDRFEQPDDYLNNMLYNDVRKCADVWNPR
jgi:phosphonate transport system substrate-binding protein